MCFCTESITHDAGGMKTGNTQGITGLLCMPKDADVYGTLLSKSAAQQIHSPGSAGMSMKAQQDCSVAGNLPDGEKQWCCVSR